MYYDLICSNIAFPFCSIVGPEYIQYDAKCTNIIGLLVNHPALLSLIIIEILMIVRAIYLTHHSYLNSGRKQITFIFFIYLAFLLVHFLLISQLVFSVHSIFHYLLTAIEMGLVNAFFFSLPLCLIFISRSEIEFIQYIVYMYFLFSLLFNIIFLKPETFLLIFALLFGANLFFCIIFGLSIFICLYKLEADFWAYGTFLCGTFCFLMSNVLLIGFSDLIFSYSNSYLDNLFFYHLINFAALLLFHKLWDSLSSREEECMTLFKNEIIMFNTYRQKNKKNLTTP